MKNRFCKIITSALIITLFSFQCHLLVAQSISVEPDYIEFDWEAGNSRDALTISDDSGVEIVKPEYYPWYNNRNNPVAYIKSQSTRKIKVQFKSSNFDGQAHLLINLTKSGGTGTAIGSVCNLFIPNYDFYTPDEREITLTGTFPTKVGKHNFTWEWEIYAIPVNEPSYCATWSTSYTEHTYYVVYALPRDPMDEPWTNVLDYACGWASGQSTATSIAQKVTDGIYYHLGDTDGNIDYDWPLGGSEYRIENDHWKFNLNAFLSDINNSSEVKVNCDDTANLFNIFTLALGLNSYSKRIKKPGTLLTFETNEIDPIGSAKSWNVTDWNNHHYGWYVDSVYDACIRVNHSDPILPTNMKQVDYDNYLLAPNNDYDESYIGIVGLQ